MDTRKAYDIWSKQYDIVRNKTRDLEAKALRITLDKIAFDTCLEIGCGTGKNTEWLIAKAKHITAVDFSDEMIAVAKDKLNSDKVDFVQADITKNWTFTNKQFELVCSSLVLEHIENLDKIFREVSKVLIPGGYVYIGELHPFKQYSGSKAKFETDEGIYVLDCFIHNISDFIKSAKQYGLEIKEINEHFDSNDMPVIPRVLTLLFQKSDK